MSGETEIAAKADFAGLRYAQCWEDAEVLVGALRPRPGDRCLSIASAGDNALALLLGDPAEVLAVDLSPAQLAALALRVAAISRLTHAEFLQLLGASPASGEERLNLYQRCRDDLSEVERAFWDNHPGLITLGIAMGGRFERYFRIFRRWILPLVHGRKTREALFTPRTSDERIEFYTSRWDTWRWRALFRCFFSRRVMGWLGRDPSFFQYVEGSVADRILTRTRYALETLDPSRNPYLQTIVLGAPRMALPLAWRAESFDCLRERIDRIHWRQVSIEAALEAEGGQGFDCFNLSDIFEYMNEERYEALLTRIVAAANPGARLAYWNMLAPRQRPPSMAGVLRSREDEAEAWLSQDQAFFYSRFVLEEVCGDDA